MIRKVSPDIFEIRTPLGDAFVNVYLVRSGNQAVLIDSGLKQTASRIFHLLDDLGFSKNSLKYLINTHSHHDHIGANGDIQTECGCRVLAHEKAVPWIENHRLQFHEFLGQFPALLPPSQELEQFFFENLGEPGKVNETISGESRLKLAAFPEMWLLPLSGHSEDSIGVYLKEPNILIAGDAILCRGVGRGLPQYEDRTAYLQSIQKIRDLNPDILLTAHFDPLAGNELREFLNQSEAAVWEIDSRIAAVKQQLGENAPLWDVAKAVHRGAEKELTIQGLLTIRAHLNESGNS
ncbi:MAG: MBL fold metallo-hydrolase [Calditrichaeota bacterium]|nr:MBL fold metallo-hydrolase [Calditrichota bacterium]